MDALDTIKQQRTAEDFEESQQAWRRFLNGEWEAQNGVKMSSAQRVYYERQLEQELVPIAYNRTWFELTWPNGFGPMLPVAIVFALCTVFSGEYSSNMQDCTLTTRKRKVWTWSKIAAGMLTTLIFVLAVHGGKILTMGALYGFEGWNVPAESLINTSMRGMSIGTMYLCWMAGTVLASLGICGITLYASAKMKHPMMGLLLAAGICAVLWSGELLYEMIVPFSARNMHVQDMMQAPLGYLMKNFSNAELFGDPASTWLFIGAALVITVVFLFMIPRTFLRPRRR